MKHASPFAACILTVALAGCGDSGTPDPRAAAETGQLPRVGLDELQAIIAQADAADQILVLDFWATWCLPCVEMFPLLHGELKGADDVRLVSVTLDSPDLEEQAMTFLRENDGLHDAYMLMPDSDAQMRVLAISDQWNDLQVPAILVYGPDGQMSQAFLGSSKPAEEVQRIVQHVRDLKGEEANQPQ